ncbi:XRE family transcriptional regulator [Pseudomonas ficuserectae]|uniref:CI repressor protein n=1 Tax=Pseudomonas amygdali pv. lachrymans TaxID=53707 RepID=A0AB37R1S1_PSEAV|nr:LexA family transcriptional regulator [Pseudomonas amygdali]KPB98103.1 CI repressor protein [Pseudomonas amygdali pv. lachrymans]RMM34634.1 CI repressor protein [Pseudomonas amygdali pv. lachrymans]RMU16058.1 CI repressor protein [Pseudomonas amygdali pv. lachrymans]WIO56290.1 LexA family transcriptional regulator [Pseudomonas amygdali pv. lachrymans]
MKKPTRTPLADWQEADAERLRALYKRRVQESKARGDVPTLNQAEVGERCGWNSPQSAFSQYANGKVALNLDALVKLAAALDFRLEEVSPTLASGIVRAVDDAPSNLRTADSVVASTPLPAGSEKETDLDSSYSFIPQYTAMAAAGAGHDNPHVEIRSTLAFKKEWLATKGLQPRNLRVIYADGESMWPTINNQDVLLVDSSQVEPVENGVFVIESGIDGTVVKRLVRAPLQQWILRSDNTDKAAYPDRFYLRSESNEHQIVGRVIWRGGDL